MPPTRRDLMAEIHVRRASGLLQPFDPPEISVEAAISRSWELQPDGILMAPKEPEFLPTYPLPGAFSIDVPGGRWADWSDYAYQT